MSDPQPAPVEVLSLDDPVGIRAHMARGGIAPMQLRHWWSPDTESDVNPLADPEIQAEVRMFLARLWAAALSAETERRARV